jgi:hypothetical protein
VEPAARPHCHVTAAKPFAADLPATAFAALARQLLLASADLVQRVSTQEPVISAGLAPAPEIVSSRDLGGGQALA